MSYELQEKSLDDGQPNELYEFAVGASIYRLTSGEDQLVIDSNAYDPVEISRSNIIMDVQERSDVLTVSMPASHTFPRSFVGIVPGQMATLQIKRYHRTDVGDEVVVIFYGRVLSVSFNQDGVLAELMIKTLQNNMNAQIPRRTYQSLCNWVLYSPNCGIASSAHRFNGDISNVDGNNITVPGLVAAKGDEWSTGGFVSLGALDFRFVIKQKNADLGTDVIQMLLPFSFDVSGYNVDVYAGCAHNLSTCSSKYNNVTRFGGCPWVPTKNIFVTGMK